MYAKNNKKILHKNTSLTLVLHWYGASLSSYTGMQILCTRWSWIASTVYTKALSFDASLGLLAMHVKGVRSHLMQQIYGNEHFYVIWPCLSSGPLRNYSARILRVLEPEEKVFVACKCLVMLICIFIIN